MPSKHYISASGKFSEAPSFKCPERVGRSVAVVRIKDHIDLNVEHDVWMMDLDELGIRRRLSELNKNNQRLEFSLLGIHEAMADENGYIYIILSRVDY